MVKVQAIVSFSTARGRNPHWYNSEYPRTSSAKTIR